MTSSMDHLPEGDILPTRSKKKKGPDVQKVYDLRTIKQVWGTGKNEKYQARSRKFWIEWQDGSKIKWRAPSVIEKKCWIECFSYFCGHTNVIPPRLKNAAITSLDWLKAHGTGSPGLFRVSGEKVRMRQLLTSLLVRGPLIRPVD